jgi:predicted ATPase/class 3 adenylate cyclase
MRCPACQSACPAGSRFCNRCGARLPLTCARCSSEIPPDSQFCNSCGAQLAASPAKQSPVAARLASAEAEGERRQITVLFCDIAGSTPLACRIDAELWREVLSACQEAWIAAVEEAGGWIAQVLGDGLLAYFGWPIAHEDGATRAVHAGLAIVEACGGLQPRLAERMPVLLEQPLEVRVAIHTGPVVVSEMGGGQRREKLAVGDTLNLAARLQSLAEPGQVVISEATRRLVERGFELVDLGAHALRGIDEPVRAARAVRPRTGAGLEPAATAGLTPFVGREQELALLLDRFQSASAGRGEAVWITGEGGMGKSRLLRALRERLEPGSYAWLECRGDAHREGSPFHPVIGLVERTLGLAPELAAEERHARIAAALERAGLDPMLHGPALAPLFLGPADERERRGASPEGGRRLALRTLASWLFAQAGAEPLVLAVEDLHWIDPSTLELLELVIARASDARMLLLLTARPEFTLAERARAAVLQIGLGPLSAEQSATIVRALAEGHAVPAPLVEELVTRSDGVPLFVEELTRNVVESGLLDEGRAEPAEAWTPPPVPATLQDSLMARLDRLGPAKEVAQVAAVFGREFSFALLREALGSDPPALSLALEQLVRAGILQPRGAPPDASYAFRHALIQETAYQSLLQRTRRRCHARFAQVLAERFPELAAAQPDVMARHYEEAGMLEPAVAQHERAGAQAIRRSAHLEAIWHLSRAIELLHELPEDPARDRQEAALQLALGVPLQARRGYADPDVRETYERALALCEADGDAGPRLFQALYGLAQHYNSRAELETAGWLCERMLALAEGSGDAAQSVAAHAIAGVIDFWKGGGLARSLEHAERALAQYDAEAHASLAHRIGQDPGVAARAYGACALALTGRVSEGRRWIDAAVAEARRLGNPFDLAFALAFAAIFHQSLRERDGVRERAGEGLALSTEHGFPLYRGMAQALGAWADCDAGRAASASEEIRQGLAEAARTGNRAGGPYGTALLAEAQLEAGELGRARETLATCFAIAEASGTHVWDAELHRLRGVVALRSGPSGEKAAEAAFVRAIEVARERGVHTQALRAALDLSRLLAGWGREREARDVLASACAACPDGIDPPELREALALLRASDAGRG